MKTYVVTPHKNRLGETILMVGHNIWFNGKVSDTIHGDRNIVSDIYNTWK